MSFFDLYDHGLDYSLQEPFLRLTVPRLFLGGVARLEMPSGCWGPVVAILRDGDIVQLDTLRWCSRGRRLDWT